MSDKKPKDVVDYGPGEIDGQHCGACTHFVEPIRCELVYGKIRSGGWCRLFEKKGAAETTEKESDDGASEKAE